MAPESSERTDTVTNTAPGDWKYISEGGATIVFSYVGAPNDCFDGMVLRLRKAVYPDLLQVRPLEVAENPHSIRSRIHNIKDRLIHGFRNGGDAAAVEADISEDEPDDPMIEYQHQCMEKLIPPEHLPVLKSVRVNDKWLKALGDLHEKDRPEERRKKDGIDMTRKKGVLATDLIGSDGLAVEIKPKWAFLPQRKYLSPENEPIKSRTCRFCMHSNLKLSEGDTVAAGYCPLDLFSGQSDRMKKSVEDLWDAWIQSDGVVNNLKVFVDGKTIKPSEGPTALATQLSVDSSDDLASLRPAFTDIVVELLTSAPVLLILSTLQRTLDNLDIEGLSALWKHAQVQSVTSSPTSSYFAGHESCLPSDLAPPSSPLITPPPNFITSPIGVPAPHLSVPEPTIADWSAFLSAYLSSTFPQNTPNLEDIDFAGLRYHLLAYLLSATFKDCSIILRPQQGKVTVIDLDPKSLDRLRKWEKLDQKIVTEYAKLPESKRKVCIDARAGDASVPAQ